jgi:putative tryptophan/tyrosine transport system substrate-binding protein
MNRREFIAGIGGAAAWPMAARAQQPTNSRVPVIGYVGAGSSDAAREVLAAFHRGLSEAGYVEGRNVAVEYRWADSRLDRLPAIANDLVHRPVAVIIALQSTAAALAVKASTRSIPIVFEIGTDPVEAGLVVSLNQPGGNVTGIFNLIAAVAAKRLELLHDVVPSAPLLAYLVNPANAVFAEAETREMQSAARFLGLRLLILNASDRSEIETAFTTLVREGAGGLVIGGDLLFTNNASQLIALATRNAIPTSYGRRDHAMSGGLMSYGTDFADMYRQVGIYTGRILKGEKPGDLPVQLVTKMQLAINLKTASALNITFPLSLLVRADEVIE